MSEKIPTGKTSASEGAQTTSEAEALAKIASLVDKKEVTPDDLQQRQTEALARKREDLLLRVRGVFKYNEDHNYSEKNIERYFKDLPAEIWEDADFIIRAVDGKGRESFTPHFMRNISEKLKDDRDFFLKIAELSGLIEQASERIRGDKEVVLAAVKSNPNALRFASDAMKDDKDVVLEVATRGLIGSASEKLRGNRELALLAVRQNAYAFESLSKELRGDKEIAMLAVEQNGYMMGNVSEELRGDKEVAMKAAQSGHLAFNYSAKEFQDFSKELQTDHDVALAFIRTGHYRSRVHFSGYQGSFRSYVDNLPAVLLQDKSFVSKAMEINVEVLLNASPDIKSDKELVLRYLTAGNGFPHGWSLSPRFPDSIREDKEFILDCLKKGIRPEALEGISDKLREDTSFILEAVEINPKALEIASDDIKKKIRG